VESSQFGFFIQFAAGLLGRPAALAEDEDGLTWRVSPLLYCVRNRCRLLLCQFEVDALTRNVLIYGLLYGLVVFES